MEYDYTYELIEKILLKRSLTDKKYLNIMSNIFDSRWFDKNRNISVILDVAIKYYKKYMKVPESEILRNLLIKYCDKHGIQNTGDIFNTLLDVNSTNTPIDDECANKNLEKYISEKAFYYIVSDNVQEIIKTGNVDKCLERFEKIRKISFQDDDLGMSYFDKEDMDKHWEYIMNPDAKISTGWPTLDDATNGGFLKNGKMLALFVAQPGLGKSLFLANIAVNFLRQNKSVVVISLEMSQDVYSQRFDAVLSRDDINNLKETAKTSRNTIETFYKNHPSANLIIKEYPPKSTRVIDIESYLDKLVDNGIKIDAIVIDYLNLLLPNNKSDNLYESIKAVSEQLRSISYKYNAPVISATQSNRSGINNTDIDLANISESNGQAATADFVGMLFAGDEDRQNGKIRMRLAKNRFGAPGRVIQFSIDPKNLSVRDDLGFNPEDEEEEDEADLILSNTQSISADATYDI